MTPDNNLNASSAATTTESVLLDKLNKIWESPDYKDLVRPWGPVLAEQAKSLIALMVTDPENQEKIEQEIDKLIDGEYGIVLTTDERFLGNAFHCFRQIAAGNTLERRLPSGRGVSDKSGK